MTDKMMIMTVRGPVPVESVACVLPHEHLLHRVANVVRHDSSNTAALDAKAQALYNEGSREAFDNSIHMHELHELRVAPHACDGRNLRLDKPEEAARELEPLVSSSVPPGRSLIVDTTLPIEGRDAFETQRQDLAKRLDLHVVTVTTLDREQRAAIPEYLPPAEQSERIAKILEHELYFGRQTSSGSTAPSPSTSGAGAIYQQIHSDHADLNPEEAVLAHGIALAQSRTHAPVYLSVTFEPSATQPAATVDLSLQQLIQNWIRALLAHGVESRKIVVCHADRWCEALGSAPHTSNSLTANFLALLGSMGVTLLFDMIGLSHVSDRMLVNPCLSVINSPNEPEPPRDRTIAQCIGQLVAKSGFVEQILLSTNIQQRVQYRRYGGGGYLHLFQRFKQQLLLQPGVTEDHWTQMTEQNPRRLLAWYVVPEAAPIPKHYLICSICKNAFEPIEGEYFTKFQFIYCGTKCLRRHSRKGFAELPE